MRHATQDKDDGAVGSVALPERRDPVDNALNSPAEFRTPFTSPSSIAGTSAVQGSLLMSLRDTPCSGATHQAPSPNSVEDVDEPSIQQEAPGEAESAAMLRNSSMTSYREDDSGMLKSAEGRPPAISWMQKQGADANATIAKSMPRIEVSYPRRCMVP